MRKLILLLLSGLVFSCSKPLPILGVVPDFTLTRESGAVVSLKDFQGHLWVADFIYSNCGSTCPMLTQRMKELGESLKDQDVLLASFSVDPDTDTPEKLKQYAERFEANPKKWLFLTGSTDALRRVTLEGFKLSVAKDVETPGDIFHSNKLVLIDASSRIRGYYEADPEGLKALKAAIAQLQSSGGS